MTADLFARLFLGFGLLLLAAAVSPLLARKRTLAGVVNLVLIAASAVLLLTVSADAVFGGAGHATHTLAVGSFRIPLLVDGLAGLFLAVVAFMAVMSAIYSVRYMDRFADYGLAGYYLCTPLFVLGMAALTVVDDLGPGFALAWQVMTIASFFLIRFEHRQKPSRRSAARYLFWMEIAWLLVTAGAFFVDGYEFGEPLAEVAAKLGAAGALPLAGFFAFLLAGFGLKAGIFPLGQLWLPGAYADSPAPVSALLSSATSKTGVYGLLRVFLFMAPVGSAAFDVRTWGLVVASVGAVTLFIGTIQAMKQSDAKLLLAYSSIGQIGYIVLAIGAVLWLGATGDPALRSLAVAAAVGALFHVLNHSVFKGMLFLTGGSIVYATGTRDLNKLGGLIRLMPVSAAVAGIASLSIAGMPPFSGFSSKWAIVSSTLLAGNGALALVIFGIVALFTSAVTLACYVKFFGMAFTSSGSEWNVGKTVREVPASMLAPKLALTAVALVQGLFPALSVGLVLAALQRSEGFLLADAVAAAGPVPASALGVGLGGPAGLPQIAAAAPLVVVLLLGLGLALGALLRRSAGSKEVEAPTWLCGYQDLNNANRYADRGMFAGLRGLFKFAGGKSGK